MDKIREMIKTYIPYNNQELVDKELMLDFIINNHDCLSRSNEKGHLTVSCWITNKKHDRYLMCYHNIYDSYSWCGGHLDGDSDLIRMALKEANEETGITDFHINNNIYSLEILEVKEHMKRGKLVKAHTHYNITFLLETDCNNSLKIKEDENSDLKWFTAEEVLTKPKEKWMIENIYKKLLEKKI